MVRVAFLGPRGTFSEGALDDAAGSDPIERLPQASIYEAVTAVDEGRADRALVPFENSIEGAVRATLDALAFDAEGVTMVGEVDFPIRHCLIAREPIELADVEVVLSHPQASAQCARFIRAELPGAEVRGVSSNAEGVRQVSESQEPWAALGPAGAAEIYGGTILRDGVEDEPDNVTRFVWLAPSSQVMGEVAGEGPGDGHCKTTLIFSELGADHPGALVEALAEFSERGVNLTRIESRPLRQGLGRYMFFIDLEGPATAGPVAEAIAALEGKAENVRILGSYPLGRPGVP